MKMDWLSIILLACIVCGSATSEDNEVTSTMGTTITKVTTKDTTTTEGELRDTSTTEGELRDTTTTEGTTKEATTTEGRTKDTTADTTKGEPIEITTTKGTTKESTTETTTTEGTTKETTTTEGTTKETTTTEGTDSDTITTSVTTIITEGETIATTGEITSGDMREIFTGVSMTTESIPGEVSNADTMTEGTTIKLSIPVMSTSSGLEFSTNSPSQTASDLAIPLAFSVDNNIQETQSGTSISGNTYSENIEISIAYSQEHDNSHPDTLVYSTKDLDSLSVDPAVANEIFSESTPQSETTVVIPEDLTMESMSDLMSHSTQVKLGSPKIVTKNPLLDDFESKTETMNTSIPSNAGINGVTFPSTVSSDESTSVMLSNSVDDVDSPMLEAMKPSTEIPLVSTKQDISMLDTSVPSDSTLDQSLTGATIPVASTVLPVTSTDIPVDLTSSSNSPTFDSAQSTSFSSSMVASTETTMGSVKSSTSYPMGDDLNTVNPVDSKVGNNKILIDQSLDPISTTEDTFVTEFISTAESLTESSNAAPMSLDTVLAEASSEFDSKLSDSTPTADPAWSSILKKNSHLKEAHENIAEFLHAHTSPLLNKLDESRNFDQRRDKKSTDFTNNQQSNYQEHFDFYRSVSDSLTSLEKRLG